MTNLNGLFKQFVSTITANAGGFVNAFDNSGDKIVLKAEFQANMWQHEADWVNKWNGESSKYNDLIDHFWSSFDDISKKGTIYDTNIQHAFAMDSNESKKVQEQMDALNKINDIVDNAINNTNGGSLDLSFLKKYPAIANLIKAELANLVVNNGAKIDENNLKEHVNNIINANVDAIKKLLLNDLLNNGSLKLNYIAVEGYNPMQDATLMSLISSKMAGFSGGIEGLKEYLSSGVEKEIAEINNVANAYLSDDTKLDPNNNYQVARLAAIYFEQAKNLIPADLNERQREKALARAREVANEAAKEILGNNSNANLTLGNACKKTEKEQSLTKAPKAGEFDLTKTTAGTTFYTYVNTLSLGDFNEKDDKAFFDDLVGALKGKGYTEDEAKKIAQYLADNDKNIAEFQALIEFVAEKFICGDINKDEINKTIIDAIVNGKMGTSITSWLEYLEKEAGITNATGSTPGENNPGGAEGVPQEKIEVAKLKGIAPIGTEYSFNYYDADGNSYPLNTQNFNDLYKDGVYVNIYGKHSKNWGEVDVITPARENLNKLADLIKKSLLATGKFDEAKLDQAVQNVVEFYISNLHSYNWSNGHDNVTMDDTPSEFAKSMADKNYSGLCCIYNDSKGNNDAWEAKYFMVGFKEFTDAIVNEYNDINLGNTDLYSLDSVKFNNTDETIASILLDDKANGLLLANWSTLPSAKSTAKLVIENTLNQLGDQLKEAGLNEAKVDYAIITTINLYKAAIDCINDIRTDKGSTDKDYNVKYKDKNGKDMSYNYNYTQYTGEYGKDCDIINGSGMIGLSNSGNLGLRMEEAYNYGGGDNTANDNRYTIAVNMRCLLETVNSFL